MSGAASAETHATSRGSGPARALVASACLAALAGHALASLSPAVGLGVLIVGLVCFLALVWPPAAFLVVAAGLPFYQLAAWEVVPGLRLTSLELVGAFLLLGLMLPRPMRLAPGIRELPGQFWLLAALLAWGLVSAATAPFGQQEPLTSLKPFLAVLVFWFLTFTFARRRNWFVLLITALAVGTVGAQSLGLPQAVTRRGMGGAAPSEVVEMRGRRFVKVGAVRVVGLMPDPNFYAYASAVALPLCLAGLFSARRRKVLWGIAGGVLAAALIVSYSRGALIAAAAALGWFVLRVRAFRLPAVAVLLVAVAVSGAVAPGAYVRRMHQLAAGQLDESILLRFRYARLAIDLAASHPLFGIGVGNFMKVNPREQEVHNTYLQVAAEIGIPGLGIFAALLALSVRDLLRARKRLLESGEMRQVVVMAAVESAVVGTMVFWLFFSMFGNKTAWFLLGVAAAAPHAVVPPGDAEGLAPASRRGAAQPG